MECRNFSLHRTVLMLSTFSASRPGVQKPGIRNVTSKFGASTSNSLVYCSCRSFGHPNVKCRFGFNYCKIPSERNRNHRAVAGGKAWETLTAVKTRRDVVCLAAETDTAGVAENRGEFSSPLAVAIRNLGLSVKNERGEVPVLKDCSLNVPEGELWMLLGPNGCGKSTLLKAMAGLLKPNRGRMFLVGPRSFVFQNPDHQVVMPTAEADVAFGLGRFDLSVDEVRERVHKSLQAVGMDKYAQRPVQTLSGGQKQRIAIAGALAESSRLLLLDELTTYLDRGDQIGVLEAVREVVGVEQRVTALWVTHRLEELEYADGAAYMENGRVVFSGSVVEVEAYIRRKQDEFYTQQGSLR